MHNDNRCITPRQLGNAKLCPDMAAKGTMVYGIWYMLYGVCYDYYYFQRTSCHWLVRI